MFKKEAPSHHESDSKEEEQDKENCDSNIFSPNSNKKKKNPLKRSKDEMVDDDSKHDHDNDPHFKSIHHIPEGCCKFFS